MADATVSEIVTERLNDGSTSIKGPRGATVVFSVRTDDVMRIQLTGHVVGEMMAKTLSAIEQAVKSEAQFSIVIDAEHQTGYEPDVRSQAQAWLVRNRERLKPAHLLTRTPMVKMGMQMFNLALGANVFKLYEDRAEFERGVAQVVRDSEKMRVARRV